MVTQDPTSLYYLHPSDNPSMKLVSLKFDETAYNDWTRSMLISLSAKNKIVFVDGTLIKPLATSNSYKAWERCNSMLISWILGVLDQNIARSVLYFTTVREVWLNLEERFGQASGSLLFELQQSLFDPKQGGDSVSAFYTKIKMIWDQLDSIDPIPMCNCTNCTCNISQKLVKS